MKIIFRQWASTIQLFEGVLVSGVKVSFADRDLNTQGVENIVEYLGIQRQGEILRPYFLLNIMFHGPKSNSQ